MPPTTQRSKAALQQAGARPLHLLPLVLGLVGALLLGVGPTLAQQATATPRAESDAFLPRDTWLYATMTTRPGPVQAAKLAAVAEVFTSQPGYQEALQALLSESANATDVELGLDVLEKVVLPLLDGEIAVGVYGDIEEPTAVGFIHSHDPEKLMRLIASFSKTQPTFEVYRGATLSRRLGESDGKPFAGAAYQNWVVLSEQPATVEQTIDRMISRLGNDLSLSTRYREIVDRLPSQRLGYLYLETSKLLEAGLGESDDLGPLASQPMFDTLFGRVGLAVAAGDSAIELYSVTRPDRAPRRLPAAGDTAAVLRMLPADTLLAFGGSDLGYLYSTLDEVIRGLGGTSLEQMIRQEAGLDLELSQWLGGEYVIGLSRGTLRFESRAAMGPAANASGAAASGASTPGAIAAPGPESTSLLRPTSSPVIAKVPSATTLPGMAPAAATPAARSGDALEPTGYPDGAFIVRVRDVAAAQRDLRKLAAMVPATPVTYAGVQYQQVSLPDAPVLTYGLKGDWLYVVMGRAERVLGSAADSTLDDNPRFALVRSVITPNGTGIFADLYGIRQVLESSLSGKELEEYRTRVRPFLVPFWALATNSFTESDGTTYGRMVVRVNK